MEIDKTERMLKNSLKNVEKIVECKLRDVDVRHTDSKNCLEKLREELISKEIFVNKSEDELRRLHFLLLLSTDLPICEELSCNRDLGHFVDFLPTLNPYLYFVLCERFKLFKYTVETIRWTPSILAVELITLVNAQIKNIPVRPYFELLSQSLIAIFSRLHEDDAASVPKHLADHFQWLFLLFKDDDQEHKKNQIERCERYGHKWLALIRLVYFMTRIRFNLASSIKLCDFYDFETEENSEEVEKHETIGDMYECTFYKCRCFADGLDIDMFMAWHEIKYDETSLQNVIGEEAYYLRELLLKYKDSEMLPTVTSELLTILEHVQRKPDINRAVQQKLGRIELENEITRRTKLDEEFLRNVQEYLNIGENTLSSEVSNNLLRKLCSESVTSDVDDEMMKNIGLTLLRKMDFDKISLFVGEFLNDFGNESILHEPSLDLTSLVEQINTINDDEEEDLKVSYQLNDT